MAEVVLEDITKVYSYGFQAVTDVSLDSADGESDVEELGHGDQAAIVARFDPRSRVRIADDVTIAVDTTRMQFFDLAIWD